MLLRDHADGPITAAMIAPACAVFTLRLFRDGNGEVMPLEFYYLSL
jgi:hypothetical protein